MKVNGWNNSDMVSGVEPTRFVQSHPYKVAEDWKQLNPGESLHGLSDRVVIWAP